MGGWRLSGYVPRRYQAHPNPFVMARDSTVGGSVFVNEASPGALFAEHLRG